MKLPQNLLSPGVYTKPRLFLCQADKEKICELDASNVKGSFKFNSYSELSFEVGRVYNDIINGSTKVNPYYDKIEATRLLFLENFGYFELQAPELTSDGIKESKSCTAYSLEYTLSQKYLENFYINTGEVDSVEVIYAQKKYKENANKHIVPVSLYNSKTPELSLLHLVLEKDYGGWKIGHVDDSLKTLSRQFEVDRESIYDFLMNEVCEKFNCYIVFDTMDNTINLYAESLTSKFIGDGATNVFTISPPFSQINTVSVDGYKTTRWQYDELTGTLTLDDTPAAGAHIEVVDGALTEWETDVFVTFDNLSQEIKIDYNADDIKTVLTVTYGDDGDIREINLGLPYITDLSYFYTVDWMGQDLYDAYTTYLQKTNSEQTQYTENSKQMQDYAGWIDFEKNRLSLQYSEATSVNAETVGTYYIRGGTHPHYYYLEVSLPSRYNAYTTYYSPDTTNLTEEKVDSLYTVLKKYFNNENEDSSNGNTQITSWKTELAALSADFKFMKKPYDFDYLSTELAKVNENRVGNTLIETAIMNFLETMWNEIGRTPLQSLYYEKYKQVQITNIEAGWSQQNNPNYGYYYPVVLLLNSLTDAFVQRDASVKTYEAKYEKLQKANLAISNDLLLDNNFTEGQLARLNAFLREDELHLDDIVETSQDSISDSYEVKQDAMEAGRIELNKRCQPQLQFSMSMANIYALPEFEPIIDQFQLGKVIKVGLRPDYIKQSRILQVDINFDDFSDFSVEFGELTSLRSQSDIHADLLKKAVQAGKSVATNASYWTKGSEQANSIDLRLQEGLLNSIEALKNLEGTQNVSMDKWGIHLQKINASGEIDPKQCWLVNNQIVFTDDSFKSSKSVLGEFTVDGETFYGLLAQAIISGYIEGSQIRGGTIQIGEQADGTYAFEVHPDGSVTMNGGSSIAGYAKEEDVNQLINNIDTTVISNTAPENAKEGQLWLDTSIEPYKLMVFTNGEWQYFSQKNGETIYITQPQSYNKGDLWIVNENDLYNSCRILDGLASTFADDLLNNNTKYYTKNGEIIEKLEYKPYEGATKDNPGNYTGNPDELIDYHIYTSYNAENIPNHAVMYHGGFFGSVGYNWNRTGDRITIYSDNNEVICSQSDIKYYGTDMVAHIDISAPVDVYIIYSDGTIYLFNEKMQNNFFCEKTSSKFVNGTLLQAIESSSTFTYDHWVDISPEDTEQKNNIYQNFVFNKENGLVIGQTDNEFYVKIDSQEMGFYDNSKGQKEKVVYISNSTANIDNVLVEGSAEFNCNTKFNQQVDFFGFIWKKEGNGSLSLAIDN